MKIEDNTKLLELFQKMRSYLREKNIDEETSSIETSINEYLKMAHKEDKDNKEYLIGTFQFIIKSLESFHKDEINKHDLISSMGAVVGVALKRTQN